MKSPYFSVVTFFLLNAHAVNFDQDLWITSSFETNPGDQRLAFGNGVFVSLGTQIFTTSDGITGVTNSGFSVHAIKFLNGRFIGSSGNSGGTDDGTPPYTFFTSSVDGTNWISTVFTNLPSAGDVRAITYGNGKYLGISEASQPFWSDTGEVWVKDSNLAKSWGTVLETPWDLASGNGVYVGAFGFKGELYFSLDGLEWTETGAGGVGSIAFGNGVFVATGMQLSKAKLFSHDGVHWSSIQLPDYFKTPIFGNGRFFATTVTTKGEQLVSSFDGENWQILSEQTPGVPYSLAAGNGRLLLSVASGTQWTLKASPLFSAVSVQADPPRLNVFAAPGSKQSIREYSLLNNSWLTKGEVTIGSNGSATWDLSSEEQGSSIFQTVTP